MTKPKLEIAEVKGVKEGRVWVKKCGEKSKVLSFVELYLFRKATMYVLHENERPLSYHLCYFGKRLKDGWGPYQTCYASYTIKSARGKGYGKKLILHARKLAIKAGCTRMRVICGSIAGTMLYASLNSEFWGLTEKLEVKVDMAITETGKKTGTPPYAAENAGTKFWSLKKLMSKIPSGKLPYDEKETK